jgi:hypothetical protein
LLEKILHAKKKVLFTKKSDQAAGEAGREEEKHVGNLAAETVQNQMSQHVG